MWAFISRFTFQEKKLRHEDSQWPSWCHTAGDQKQESKPREVSPPRVYSLGWFEESSSTEKKIEYDFVNVNTYTLAWWNHTGKAYKHRGKVQSLKFKYVSRVQT